MAVYRTTCGCLASAPEPRDYTSAEWLMWDTDWMARVDAHHARCCQARQRGDLGICYERHTPSCPQGMTPRRPVEVIAQ